MCLIVFAWQQHPDFPLIMAANRDEFHARPTEPMGWWEDTPALLAGRDLKAGGTWLGVSRDGRVATVTNYRESIAPVSERSRGEIVTAFVGDRRPPDTFLDAIDGHRYAGFSALATDGTSMVYRSNRGDAVTRLEPGVYGLSNASLDTPWPKLLRTRSRLASLAKREDILLDDLFDLVADREPASDAELRDTDLPFEISRPLSSPFIVMPDYGTRCSTALVCRADGHVEIAERRFDASGATMGESRFVFLATAWRAQAPA
jgi:uncharacterized protein with NRDE domain